MGSIRHESDQEVRSGQPELRVFPLRVTFHLRKFKLSAESSHEQPMVGRGVQDDVDLTPKKNKVGLSGRKIEISARKLGRRPVILN